MTTSTYTHVAFFPFIIFTTKQKKTHPAHTVDTPAYASNSFCDSFDVVTNLTFVVLMSKTM